MLHATLLLFTSLFWITPATGADTENECSWEDVQAFGGGLGVLIEQAGRSNRALGSASFINIDRKSDSCRDKTRGLPAQMCAGRGVCGPNQERRELVCEKSGDTQCPPPDECRKPGVNRGNPLGLETIPYTDEERLAVVTNIDKELKAKGSPPRTVDVVVLSGVRLRRTAEPNLGICAMQVRIGKDVRDYYCLAENCLSVLKCGKDPCVEGSDPAIAEASYPKDGSSSVGHGEKKK